MRKRVVGAVAVLAAASIAATWAAGGFSREGGSASVVRAPAGWTVTLPSAFHRRTFDLAGPDWSARGVSIGNFQPLPAAENGQAVRVPAQGVLFQLYTVVGSSISPLGQENALPLKLHSLPGGPAGVTWVRGGRLRLHRGCRHRPSSVSERPPCAFKTTAACERSARIPRRATSGSTGLTASSSVPAAADGVRRET